MYILESVSVIVWNILVIIVVLAGCFSILMTMIGFGEFLSKYHLKWLAKVDKEVIMKYGEDLKEYISLAQSCREDLNKYLNLAQKAVNWVEKKDVKNKPNS